MNDIKLILEQAIKALAPTSPSARIDVELLLMKVLNVSRTFFYAHPEATLTPDQQEQYQALLKQRMIGTPIAHLTGIREFWSLPLNVSSHTLIPRPETELLVELTLNQLAETTTTSVLDLGTGSGAIALALASERPHWHVLACDKSHAAVNMARKNATQLGINNLNVLCSNWFDSIPNQQFNAIVSNPPYIAEHDPHLAQGDVRFEPLDALISGKDGLDALNYLIEHSQKWLVAGGLLLLEHGFDQGAAVTSALKKHGYESVHCWQDWQGHDRVSGGSKQKV